MILIDKPRDWTSFDVVARLRSLTGIRKIGHAGTLDPFADGLLTVCIGRATRLIRYMEQHDKIYRVTAVFGRATDTQDLTGQTITTHQLGHHERNQLLTTDFAVVRQAVSGLTLLTQQEPPMYSAVKVGGQPLYHYARKGRTVQRTARPIRVYQAHLDAIELHDHVMVELTIHCSKGTYIRSLCDQLGQVTGWGAHAAVLRRIACGPWQVTQAVSPQQVAELLEGHTTDALQILTERAVLLPAAAALTGMPRLVLETAAAKDLVYGRPVLLPLSQAEPSQQVAVWCGEQLIAVARLERDDTDAWRIRTERVLIERADLLRS